MNQATIDTILLAREMSMLVSPTNEEIMRRTVEDDYLDTGNVAKIRTEALELSLDEEPIPDFLGSNLTVDPFN